MPSDKFRNTSMARAVRNATNNFLSTFTATPQHISGVEESHLNVLAHMDKRSAHNALERQRREALNSKYHQLATTLPTLSKSSRPSRITIVTKSLEFVKFSKKRQDELKDKLEDLRKKNELLRSQTQRAKCAMNTMNSPSYTAGDAPLKDSRASPEPVPALTPKTLTPASSSDTLNTKVSDLEPKYTTQSKVEPLNEEQLMEEQQPDVVHKIEEQQPKSKQVNKQQAYEQQDHVQQTNVQQANVQRANVQQGNIQLGNIQQDSNDVEKDPSYPFDASLCASMAPVDLSLLPPLNTSALPTYTTPPTMLPPSALSEPWCPPQPSSSPMTFGQYYCSPSEMLMPQAIPFTQPSDSPHTMDSFAMDPYSIDPLTAHYLSQPSYMHALSATHMFYSHGTPAFSGQAHAFPPPPYVANHTANTAFQSQSYQLSFA